MPASGLLILAPVSEGREAELRETLNRFGNDIRGVRTPPSEPRIDFIRSTTIHFARLTLLEDPDRGPGRRRLLFATDYDGPWAEHVAEVLALTRSAEAIWGCCEGYAGPEAFPDFVRAHTVTPGAYYIAFRGESLGRCRDALALRAWFHEWLADPLAAQKFRALPDLRDLVHHFRGWFRELIRPLRIAWGAIMTLVEVGVCMRRLGAGVVLDASRRINATLDRVGWIRIVNRLLRNHPTPPPHSFTQALPGGVSNPTPPGYPPEDAVHQNQLTLVTVVEPHAAPRLRAVLALIDLYGRRLSPPGSLVGISTIHTVRWALIDGDRRLLMVSNYDGTWENYIDEFAEMILSGLNALWSTAPVYPQAGAQDLAALKQFLRAHQAPANVFYSAYPEASVLNLQDDLEFARVTGRLARRMAGAQAPQLVVRPMR